MAISRTSRITGTSPKSPREFWQPPPSPAPIFVAEEDGEWWARAQQNFAVIALALTVSIPTPFFHQDESVPQPTPAGYSASTFPLPVQVVKPVLRYFFDDEIVAPQTAVFTPDEDYWQSAPPSQLAPIVRIITDDDPKIFTPDEDYLQSVPPPFSLISSRIFTDDEFVQALAQFTPDEDYQFQVSPQAPALFLRSQFASDDDSYAPQAQSFCPDEDYWQGSFVQVGHYFSSAVFRDDDVIVPQGAGFVPDEDYWQMPVYPVIAWNFVLYAMFDQDQIPSIPFVPGVAFNRVELGWGGDVAADNVTLGGVG